jgi:hypothetical protein
MLHSKIDHSNPFRVVTVTYIHDMRYRPGWYFYDETGDWHGPYRSEMSALQKLLEHMARLNGMPMSRWERFWLRLRGLVRGHA